MVSVELLICTREVIETLVGVICSELSVHYRMLP